MSRTAASGVLDRAPGTRPFRSGPAHTFGLGRRPGHSPLRRRMPRRPRVRGISKQSGNIPAGGDHNALGRQAGRKNRQLQLPPTALTTAPASPAHGSSPTRRRPPPFPAAAHAYLTSAGITHKRTRPTGPRPTARPSDWAAACWTNGPTPIPTDRSRSDATRSHLVELLQSPARFPTSQGNTASAPGRPGRARRPNRRPQRPCPPRPRAGSP